MTVFALIFQDLEYYLVLLNYSLNLSKIQFCSILWDESLTRDLMTCFKLHAYARELRWSISTTVNICSRLQYMRNVTNTLQSMRCTKAKHLYWLIYESFQEVHVHLRFKQSCKIDNRRKETQKYRSIQARMKHRSTTSNKTIKRYLNFKYREKLQNNDKRMSHESIHWAEININKSRRNQTKQFLLLDLWSFKKEWKDWEYNRLQKSWSMRSKRKHMTMIYRLLETELRWYWMIAEDTALIQVRIYEHSHSKAQLENSS